MGADKWFQLTDKEIAEMNIARAAAVYLNGTRRWFASLYKDEKSWEEYPEILSTAHRNLCDLLFSHGITTLFQPMVGQDLLYRDRQYQDIALHKGLLSLDGYRAWFKKWQVRVSFYGGWRDILPKLGFGDVVKLFDTISEETSGHGTHKLLFGLFADGDELGERVLRLKAANSQQLLDSYYGQPIRATVDLIIGSGQPAVWDIPLLNINNASLYFLQAPTYCLDKETLRKILYDHYFVRVSDDPLYADVDVETWNSPLVLGVGLHDVRRGWIPDLSMANANTSSE